MSAKISWYTAHIGELEEQMTRRIMEDDILSDKQKHRKMQDEVYGKLNEITGRPMVARSTKARQTGTGLHSRQRAHVGFRSV